MPGPGWADYGPWTRRMKMDLDQLRTYAQAVAVETETWLAGLSDADLDQLMNLSGIGLGQHMWASAIALLLANHIGTETGEVAVLKGIQGARGYPCKRQRKLEGSPAGSRKLHYSSVASFSPIE